MAIAFHNMRQVDQAVTYFKQLGTVDPYRLDNLDTYSNLLYVKEQRVELAHLAHRFLCLNNFDGISYVKLKVNSIFGESRGKSN